MEIKGYTFKQQGERFYIGIISAKALVEKWKQHVWKVDVFKATTCQGYQREASESRARAFGRFLMDGFTSPPSILLNFRDGKVTEEQGRLILPDGEAWVVDGQHRVKGLEFALDRDPGLGETIELPIVIMNVPSRYEEAKQFVIINKTQKGVRTDLADRFIADFVKTEGRSLASALAQKGVLSAILKQADWIAKAMEICDMLNKRKDSVWYGRIRLPNEPRDGTIVAQKSFTDSLEPILKDSYFAGKDPKTLANALNNYWDAIKELCQAAFDNPYDYVIQKTTGVFVLHKVFPRVSEFCRDEKGNRVLTKEFIKPVLEGLTQMDSEYWHKNGEAGRRGTGKKAVSLMSIEFLEELEGKYERREEGLIT